MYYLTEGIYPHLRGGKSFVAGSELVNQAQLFLK